MVNIRGKIAALIVFCAGISFYAAQADELCADANNQWTTFSIMGGQYRIGNNLWKGTTQQCITVDADSTYFSVIRSSHDLNEVAAYPSIVRGTHFGEENTTNSGMPVLVSDIATAPVDWSVDINGADGVWNSAYESWFSKKGGTSPDAAELMIWINTKGNMSPTGSKIAAASIGGADWDVYVAELPDWKYIAYKKVKPVVSIKFDLKDFIDDAVSRGYIKTTWYLDVMEAGFEIMQDGQGLTSNFFSASVTTRTGSEPIDRAETK